MAQHPRPSHREEFEIAIICALTAESDAVEALLDEEYEPDSYGKAQGDRNAYTTGRIGNHYVVLVYMPGIGKASAAAAACDIGYSFKGIRLGILVGVCGGVPKTPDGTEIHLGDLIISNTIVQGDFGRQHPNKFIRKDTLEDNLGRANREIRSFIKRVSGQRVCKRLQNKVTTYSTDLYERDGFHQARYPGTENDKLWPAHYRHKHQDSDSCDICSRCLHQDDTVCEIALNSSCTDLGCDERLLTPRKQTRDAQKPLIHFGRIASGDVVLKSGLHRDEMVAREKVIGFEMEGAGVWDSLPTVIIKSVCDYADSHKSKVWQDYAAVIAAACMKAFLEEWASADRPLKRPISPGMHVSSSALLSSDLGMEQSSSSNKKRCLQSLSFPNIDSRRHDIAFAHHNTCEWLFTTPEFHQWLHRDNLESHNGVLWIKGKPGVGKSTLMKHALLHCQKLFPNHAIAAYFFNARGDNLEKSPPGMFRSLLYQLIEQNAQFLDGLTTQFANEQRKHGNNWEWHPNVLQSFLREILEHHQSRPMFLFVDALDECDESQVRYIVSFLEDLSLTALRSKTLLNICLSSRHYPSISMEKMLELVVERQIMHDLDIIIYVRDKLRIRDETIEYELITKAAGVFMWIVIVTEMLNKSFNEGRITAMRRILHEVPSDLDEAYLMLLQKDPTHKHQTMLMFQWVLFSKRPLEPEALYFAVLAGTKGTESEDLGPWDQSKVSSQVIEHFITTISKGLLEVRKYIHTVQFVHESVKDFLLRNRRIQILDPTIEQGFTSTSHNRLATSCLNYIKMIALDPQKGSVTTKDQVARSYPFLEYASTQLLFHAEQACGGEVHPCASFEQLQREPDLFERLKKFHDLFETGGKARYWIGTNLAYIVSSRSYQGLAETVLLQPGIDVNAQSGFYASALQAAVAAADAGFSARSRVVIVQMLLDAGADVNAQGGYYGSALMAAAVNECGFAVKEVVKMLLDAGAEVNAQDGHYGSALQAACCRADKEVVRMLLDAGADVNAQGGYYGSALMATCCCAEKGVVRMVLDGDADAAADADVNVQDSDYSTVLPDAATNGSSSDFKEIMKMLLEAGADVNAQGGRALPTAVIYHADKGVVQMLLDAGADVNAQGGGYPTALQEAANHANKEIVQMLLNAGADVNAQGGGYGNALQAAAAADRPSPYLENGDVVEVVKMLLDAGADVNARDGDNPSALQTAAYYAKKEVVQMLLHAGADVNTQSGDHGNALQAAANKSSSYFEYTDDVEEVVKMLLDAGADVNARDRDYGSALQAAAYHANKEVVQMLVNAGADVNAKGGKYGNALQAAYYHADKELVKILLDAGADVNTPVEDYGSLLQDAVSKVDKEAVDILLDAGADVNAQGGYRGSALQAAAYYADEEVVEMLLEAGAEVNAQDGHYGSALQAACCRADKEVVRVLLDAGADVNAQGGYYGSALQAAAYYKDKEVVQMLLNAGAAVTQGIAQTLKEAGVDLNCKRRVKW